MPKRIWTAVEVLNAAADYLERFALENARRDAEELLSHILQCSRLDLYLDHDRPMDAEEREQYRALLKRRARHEPLQYLIGRWPFRQLDLIVDPRALIPRPETEELVDIAMKLAPNAAHTENNMLEIIDAGCGGGCIALSLHQELADATVFAVDRSEKALELCRANAEFNGIAKNFHCHRMDLLTELPKRPVGMLVSNPPYVEPASKGRLQEELAWEPEIALYTRDSAGLEFYERFSNTLSSWIRPGGVFVLEMGEAQGDLLRILFETTATDVVIHQDIRHKNRFISGTLA